MDNPLQRLKKFIDFKKLPVSTFEKSVGFSNGSFASQLKKNKTIGLDKLENILNVYPELSGEWVVTGKGDMINFFSQLTIEKSEAAIKKDRTFTTRQRFILEDHERKLLDYIKNEQVEYATLYGCVNEIDRFNQFLDLFSKTYIDKILDCIYNSENFLIGNKFDYNAYKENLIRQFDEFVILNQPLKKLVQAVNIFYAEMQPIDKENLLKEIDY